MDIGKAQEDFARRQQELDVLRRRWKQQSSEFSDFLRNYIQESEEDTKGGGDQ